MQKIDAYFICKYPDLIIYSINDEWRLNIPFNNFMVLSNLENFKPLKFDIRENKIW